MHWHRPILCSGTTIDLDAGSGFTYLWNDATTSQTLTASASGEYSVTITDGNSCLDSDTINVTLATPLVLTLDSTNITCNGLTDGTATATVTGGTPNYTYLWDDANAQTTATATNLSAGTYTVSITDDNNCGTTGSISIAEPTLLSATTQEPPQLADFSYIGEYQNNYIYFHNTGLSWSDANQKCVNNGGQLLVINNASEQSHYASILPSYSWIGLYQDLNDPDYSESSGGWKWVDGTPLSYDNWAVGQPSGGTGENHGRFDNLNHEWHDYNINTQSPFAMAINKSVANSLTVSCFGGNDGSTYVTAAGGTSPYSYLWNDANAQTTATATNLSSGTYTVSAGELVVKGDLTNNPSLVNNGTFSMDGGNLTFSSVEGSGLFSLPDSLTMTTGNNSNKIISGTFDGNGTLVKQGSGTLTLSGSSTSFTGAININAGTISVTNSANLGATPGSVEADIVLNGGTLRADSSFTLASNKGISLTANSTINVDSGETLTYAGVIDDSSSGFGYTKSGAGILALSGSQTFTGSTTLSAGTLQVASDINISAQPRSGFDADNIICIFYLFKR